MRRLMAFGAGRGPFGWLPEEAGAARITVLRSGAGADPVGLEQELIALVHAQIGPVAALRRAGIPSAREGAPSAARAGR